MNSVNSSRKKNRVRELIDVGGITPFTTIDYPGQLAAVLFLQGCPWRCQYCHNSELIHRRAAPEIPWSSAVKFLQQRKTLIDAVVFSGGEPTLQPGLGMAVRQVKRMGFKIGLHTAGIYPDRLERLLPLVDWIGLDIKASVQQYPEVTGVKHSGERAWRSARLIVESNLDYEVRTTIHPRLIDREKLYNLVGELVDLQVENYVIQECVPAHCFNPGYRVTEQFPLGEMDIQYIAQSFTNFELRMAG
jgi:pyruvate formate lyase activating enzyme